MTDLRRLAPMLAAIMLCSSMAGCLDTLTGNDSPTAVMSVDPSETVSYTHLTLPTILLV